MNRQLFVDSLELRRMMSVTATLRAGGELHVEGDDTGNSFDIYTSGSNIVVKHPNTSTTFYFPYYTGPSSAISKITVNARGGADRVSVSDAITKSTTLSGDDGVDTLSGGSGSDDIFGGGGNDVLYGNNGNDILLGGSGSGDNDFMSGGNGDDFLYGESGDDTIYGDAGNDYLRGDAGSDFMVGGSGSDLLIANDGVVGNDVLYGGNSDGSGSDGYDSGVVDGYGFSPSIKDLNFGIESVSTYYV